ncbi:MAG: DUF2156 domain-containing protein [Proteobacteria bacterium]|nr:DUF2156 domain-containing protein [Desulfobacterales bacterium]MBL6967642.1 DUF2156 domain-containing protein [Desulfobacteraceae bacterium]MBL7172251.1 DUF2156 domain-containing protein [Desulfobacteraceae bacterium]MBU0989725.1 DUF2156 domain-containing protein [Pseudomonadota bacterium]MBU1905209.1 DUF2156 domain-containing protein [Pseudomonadota bacterium]
MTLNDFKPLEIGDKGTFDSFLRQDPPEISELTFTNLFMWRHKHRPVWLQTEACLLIIFRQAGTAPYGLPPVGPGDKKKALQVLCECLGEMTPVVRICRVPEHFIERHVDPDRYDCVLDVDNSDYIYRSQDLISLAGRKYHRKKNQVNRFNKTYQFEYREMDAELIECFMDMQENWCQIKSCVDNQDLLTEDYAIREALTHFQELDYRGGAIQIGSRLEAISLGEPLNSEIAVIHIEKANPEIPGLYAAMNQLFCSHAWSEMTYINREQDLGIEGLRNAKKSYHPDRMVMKYIITPRTAVSDL